MLQTSWDDAARDLKQRSKKSRNNFAFFNLPKVFSAKDVAAAANLCKNAASQQLKRWVQYGFVKRKKMGVYEKIVNQIDKG